jgi:hypothetical protein
VECRDNADEQNANREQIEQAGIMTMAADFPAHRLALPKHGINAADEQAFPQTRVPN